MTDTEPSATTEERPAPAGLADERFAANIRERREDRKWSQADLARRMTERGWPYYPQTVQRIEAGHRKVSVGEAKALAEILETTVDRLTWPGQEASAASLLQTYIVRVEQAFEQIGEWTYSLRHSQFQLKLTVSEVVEDDYFGSAEIRRLADEAREAMKATPEQAVAGAGEPDDEPDEPEEETLRVAH